MKNQLDTILYYLTGVVFFVALFASILGLINIKKIKFYSIFIILTFSTVLQYIYVNSSFNNFTEEKHLEISNLILNIYLIIELIIISYFFYQKINSASFKKILIIINGSLIIYLLYNLNSIDFLTVHYSEIAALEAIVILIDCIFLYMQILDDELNISILKSPDFFITSGIFFLFSFTCPFYMVHRFIENENSILYKCFYLVNHIGYIFFHISIITAFKCKIHSNRSSSY